MPAFIRKAHHAVKFVVAHYGVAPLGILLVYLRFYRRHERVGFVYYVVARFSVSNMLYISGFLSIPSACMPARVALNALPANGVMGGIT